MDSLNSREVKKPIVEGHKAITFNPAVEFGVGRIFRKYHMDPMNGVSFDRKAVNGYSANITLQGIITIKKEFSVCTGVSLEFEDFFHKEYDSTDSLTTKYSDEYFYITVPLIFSLNIPHKKIIYSPEIGLVKSFIISSVFKAKEFTDSGHSYSWKSDNTKFEMNYISLDLGFGFIPKGKRITYKLNCLIDLSKIYLLWESAPGHIFPYGFQAHDFYKSKVYFSQ